MFCVACFVFKQKTAYERRISDWSSDVCSSDLLRLPSRKIGEIRGDRISMIFQEPMTSLNPVYRIGDQIAEVVLRHRPVSRRSEEGRVGQACVSTCRSRWSPST